jgi:hypothetical protein
MSVGWRNKFTESNFRLKTKKQETSGLGKKTSEYK